MDSKENAHKHKNVWKPRPGSSYYNLTSGGVIEERVWIPREDETYPSYGVYDEDDMFEYSDDINDIRRWLIGNCFSTKDDAYTASEKIRVLADLQKFAVRNNSELDWYDYKQPKYYLTFDCDKNMISIGSYYKRKLPGVWFSSYKIAQDAIDFIGKNRLKKYLFDII